MKLIGRLFAVSAVAIAVVADPIWAANMPVCIGTTPTACGADPNQLAGAGSFNVFEIGAAGNGPLDPFLILVAVPDLPSPLSGVPGPSPVFTSNASVTITAATSAQYGQTNVPGAGGYLGEFTSGNEIYGFAGLTGGPNSMSFANFTLGGAGGAEATLLGVLPTSFSLYEFTIDVLGHTNGTDLGNAFNVNIPYSSIALGSYVGAWGTETFANGVPGGTNYATPFTTGGWINTSSSGSSSGSSGQVPEPNSSALAMLGVVMLGGVLWFRRRSMPV